MAVKICAEIVAVVLFAWLAFSAFSQKLTVREYVIRSDKIADEITIAHISDLHETAYGDAQSELVQAIDAMVPDVILMTGDMADEYRDVTPLEQLVEAIAGRYPCYYVTGNHESWTGRVEEYVAYFEQNGVRVLRGTGDRFMAGDTLLDIFGVDDPEVLTAEAWQAQLSACRTQADPDVFSILLSHRPERISDYGGFDLVLSGHAHGGQVRIPLILNGLYAPAQGWFPKYAGGRYETSGGTMIVSRGLQINALPRIFNRPELVKIRIVPE